MAGSGDCVRWKCDGLPERRQINGTPLNVKICVHWSPALTVRAGIQMRFGALSASANVHIFLQTDCARLVLCASLAARLVLSARVLYVLSVLVCTRLRVTYSRAVCARMRRS